MNKPPLILTLSIEEGGMAFFDKLRKKHFPPTRNFLDAHLTLFHALPNEGKIFDKVKALCRQQAPFTLTVKEVVSIGNGVAFSLDSSKLSQLHKTLRHHWLEDLSPQDRHTLWPHITVQNKVPAHEARRLLRELQQGFSAFPLLAIGLQLWEYLNGPWKLAEEISFNTASTV